MEYSLTMKCAKHIEGLFYDDLPKDVVQITKLCLLDFLGCVISGSITAEGKIINEFAVESSGQVEATIAGEWSKVSAMNAALANGYNCHINEFDDVHKKSILHPGAPVIAAALAIAEVEKKTGKEFIEAIVAGYEIVLRIGEAVSPSHYYFWHTTGTCGTFGAAASAGKLLKLTEKQMVDALGNAGSQAAGLWQFIEDNAMTKYLHCGKAAFNGVLSALLARKGFTGAKRILEGEKGFVKATSTESNPEKSFMTMGQQFKILETSFKPYASCRHTHSTIGAVISLRNKYNLDIKKIDKITINVYKVAIMIARNNEEYKDARAARFSLVYCAAAAMYFGDVSLKAFESETLKNPELLRLAKKISINVSEDLDRMYPQKWPAQVIVESEGRIFEEIVEYPKGDPENPFSWEDFENKFMGLTAEAMNEADARVLITKCRQLENIEDMSEFLTFIH